MRSLSKRHSWPPLRKPRAHYISKKIDEDPFAYFISPAEVDNVFLEGELAAGIRDERQSRSLSPFRHRAGSASYCVLGSSTSKFKGWIEKMERQYFHWESFNQNRHFVEPSEATETNSPPVRGRRSNRPSSRQHTRNDSRTSRRRPRAWKQPGVDIWPVAEEQEDVGLGITM